MDYNIRPLGKNCSASGEPLTPGSACFSVLVMENGKLVRLDFNEDSWPGPPDNSVAHWRSAVPEAKAETVNPLDPDYLFEYFERLSEDASDREQKMRYVLALLLVRKRRLEIDGTREDGDETFLMVSGTRGEGQYEIRDPELSDAEIEQLQEQLVPTQLEEAA